MIPTFLFSTSCDHRDLHSFPTRRSSDLIAPYDGHHIAVYIADFSGPHDWLVQRSLVTEESNPYQYRFQVIVDPAGGDRKSTRLNSSHVEISYAVFCLKKKIHHHLEILIT